MNDQIVTEPFSSQYELVHGVTVHAVEQDEAVMDYKMLEKLKAKFGAPVVGSVGGIHYQFKPMRSIPSSTLAVPARNHGDPDTLLVQR